MPAMRITRSCLTAALLPLLVVASPTSAIATPAGSDAGFESPRRGRAERWGGRGIEGLLERHGDRLDLDEETRTRIREIAAGARAEGEALGERLRSLRREMRGLLEQDVPAEEAVMRQAERIGEAETDLRKHRLRMMLRIRALLTPEQRRELIRIHQEMKDRNKARRRNVPPMEP